MEKYGPPKKGPKPQGLKTGGCPHREPGAKSDIKGIKKYKSQVKNLSDYDKLTKKAN